MNSFQTILLTIFAIFAVLGTIIFSGFFSSSTTSTASDLTIWGTMPSKLLNPFFDEFNKLKVAAALHYEEHTASSFDEDLIEALAASKGPDLIIMPQDLILRYENKIEAIPYETISRRLFQDTFIDEAQLYQGFNGILGLPLVVDPLIMYWNRDLVTNAEFAQPPKSWEQLLGMTPQLTKRDDKGNITQSAVALGGAANIEHAKETLLALLFQANQPIVARDEVNKNLRVDLGASESMNVSGADAALQFFTEFSNPTKTDIYTWNSALRGARSLFGASRLALYFAPASELALIRTDNPHLNFDTALLPQRENGSVRATFGTLFAVAPLRSSRNVGAATLAATALVQGDSLKSFAKAVGLPPARRDLLAAPVQNADESVAYRSAILAKGWLDPAPKETDRLFAATIASVVSGLASVSDAVKQLAAQLGDLLPQTNG